MSDKATSAFKDTVNIAGELEFMGIADMVNKDSEMFCLNPTEEMLSALQSNGCDKDSTFTDCFFVP